MNKRLICKVRVFIGHSSVPTIPDGRYTVFMLNEYKKKKNRAQRFVQPIRLGPEKRKRTSEKNAARLYKIIFYSKVPEKISGKQMHARARVLSATRAINRVPSRFHYRGLAIYFDTHLAFGYVNGFVQHYPYGRLPAARMSGRSFVRHVVFDVREHLSDGYVLNRPQRTCKTSETVFFFFTQDGNGQSERNMSARQ